MPDENGVVRRIAWKQICPWLMIFRVFRISISLPVLVLAVAGALLTPLGWWLSETMFVTDLDVRQSAFNEYVQANAAWPVRLDLPPPQDRITTRSARLSMPPFLDSTWRRVEHNHVVTTYRKFTSPFAMFFSRHVTTTQAAYLLFGAFWNLAVWAFFGATITRLAAVQLGRDERLGIGAAMKHVAKNYIWYLLSPLFPLLGVVLTALPVVILGALMRLDLGVVAAGVLWPFVLIAGLIMVIFLVGVMFGWPLMFPTISCESGSDAFEAFSRSFSYTFQRPLHYLFYAAVTIFFGGICWLVVTLVASQVVELSLWAASWGAGAARVNDVVFRDGGSTMAQNGGWLIRSSQGIVAVIVTAFSFAFFWCSATAIYLLLRRDADQMDIDEVFLDEATGRYGLPPLKPAASDGPAAELASQADVTDPTTKDPIVPGDTPAAGRSEAEGA